MRASGSALRHGQARAAPAQARQPAQLPGVQMWQRWAARPRPPPPLAGWLGPPPVQGCCLPAPLATGRALLCARPISMTAHVAHRSNMSALAIAEPRARGASYASLANCFAARAGGETRGARPRPRCQLAVDAELGVAARLHQRRRCGRRRSRCAACRRRRPGSRGDSAAHHSRARARRPSACCQPFP